MSTGLNASLSFSLPLTTSVVPVSSAGSSTATFTRATAATVFDWESILKTPISGEVRFQGARRVRNYFIASEDFTNVNWTVTGTATKVGTASVIGPYGGTVTVGEAAFGANAASLYYHAVAALANADKRFSIWVRAVSGTTTVRIVPGNLPSANISVNTTWQRLSDIVLGVGTGTTFAVQNNSGGNSANVYVFAAQVEDVTGQSNQNPGEYVSVGVLSSPYQGAMVDGVQYFSTQNGNTVASNVVTAGTGAAIASTTLLGYLSEEARTNNCLWNRDFTNAAWVKTTMTVAKDQAGIDGVASAASSLLATGANSTVKQTVTIAAVNRPFSVFVKRLVGTGGIAIAQDGATFTDVTASVPADSAYHRVTLVASQLNPILSIRLATSADKIAVDYAALEDAGGVSPANLAPSSPIATTTVAVTRNADLDSFALAGNLVAATGTAYAEITSAGGAPLIVLAATNGDQVIAINPATQVRFFDGTNNNAGIAFTQSATVVQKVATKWAGASGNTYALGIAGTPSAFDGGMASGASLFIGNNGAGASSLNGTIRNVKLWTVALADSQITSL